jgi:signal transduction histidine kinase
VQEALTNTRKHAPGAAARVTVGYGVEALDLRVRNGAGGVPSRGASNGSGNGMLGMRERAALFGGTFEAGALGDGGFDVHAVLPYATEVVR